MSKKPSLNYDDLSYDDKVKTILTINDREECHSLFDELLCEILIKHGYGDIVDAFKKMPKWYS